MFVKNQTGWAFEEFKKKSLSKILRTFAGSLNSSQINIGDNLADNAVL